MGSTSRKALPAFLIAFALIGAACGGGDSDDDAGGVRTLEEQTDTDTPADSNEGSSDASTESSDADTLAEEPGEADAADDTEDQEAADVEGEASQEEVLAEVDDLLLEFSQCMRDNGFADFEDMTSAAFVEAGGGNNGGQVFFQEMAQRGVNLADPAGRESLEECGEVLQQLATFAPEPSDEEVAEQEERLLDFAQCMREEGIADFPDPDFATNAGGYGVELTEQFDIEAPDFQAAGQACESQGRGFFGGDDEEGGG